jgi:hypothetical protein
MCTATAVRRARRGVSQSSLPGLDLLLLQGTAWAPEPPHLSRPAVEAATSDGGDGAAPDPGPACRTNAAAAAFAAAAASIEGAPVGLLDRIQAFIAAERAQLREDMAGRAAAAEAAAVAGAARGGGGGGDNEDGGGGGGGGAAARAAAAAFQQKLTPFEQAALMSDLFGGALEAARPAPQAHRRHACPPAAVAEDGAGGGGAVEPLAPSEAAPLAPEARALLAATGVRAEQLDAAAAGAAGGQGEHGGSTEAGPQGGRHASLSAGLGGYRLPPAKTSLTCAAALPST